ncbi:MAG: hypothetical protein AAFS10_26685 [Myxococcota bacterium]
MPTDESQPTDADVAESAEPPQEDDDSYESRILIKPNGEVVIENLSIDLMELLEMLDPDAEAACEIPEGHPALAGAEGAAEGATSASTSSDPETS